MIAAKVSEVKLTSMYLFDDLPGILCPEAGVFGLSWVSGHCSLMISECLTVGHLPTNEMWWCGEGLSLRLLGAQLPSTSPKIPQSVVEFGLCSRSLTVKPVVILSCPFEHLVYLLAGSHISLVLWSFFVSAMTGDLDARFDKVLANCFNHHASGYALYSAVSATELKLGCCGYMDKDRRWTTIV